MEALILSCGTGGGHNAAGVAVKEEMQRRGHAVTMLNPFDLKGARLARIIDQVYIKIAQRAPRLFGVIYRLGDLYRRLPWRSPVYFANGKMASTLADYLERHPVDVVIMPHVFPGEILTYMKDHGMAVPKTIFIATDYTCIPFTEECYFDACVIPSEQLAPEFLSWGIPADRIYPLGIPVRCDFSSALSQREATNLLGLDEHFRYILVSGGSIGAGQMMRVLKKLYRLTHGTAFRIIVVCGNNEKLYRTLQARFGNQLILLKSTDHMAQYMQACDLVLVKPGGLSITEAAVLERPLGLLPPIPGCESRNRKFYQSNGLCYTADASTSSLQKLLEMADSPKSNQQQHRCQREVIHKNAAQKICDLAEELASEGC
ncbi:MAG: glycosyltransferase [Roseburia sp.]